MSAKRVMGGPTRVLHDSERLRQAHDAAALLLCAFPPHRFTIGRRSAAVGASPAWVYAYLGHPDFLKAFLVGRHFSRLSGSASMLMRNWPTHGAWPHPWVAVVDHIWALHEPAEVAAPHAGMLVAATASPTRESRGWFRWSAPDHMLPMGRRQVRAAVGAAIGPTFLAAFAGDWNPAEQRRWSVLASLAVLTDKYSEHLSR